MSCLFLLAASRSGIVNPRPRAFRTVALVASVVMIFGLARYSQAATMLAAWDFEETGNIVVDRTGYGNNGYLQNMDDSNRVPGRLGYALSFNGLNQWIDFNTSSEINALTAPFSVETWVKGVATPGPTLIFDKSHGWTDATGWFIQAYGGGPPSVEVVFGFGNGSEFVGAGFGPVLDDTWHYLAGTYDGAMLRTYVDGNLFAATPVSDAVGTNTRAMEMGRSWGGGYPVRYFTGLIDDTAVYSGALPDYIIAAHAPEPSAVVLLAAGAIGLLAYRWRRIRALQVTSVAVVLLLAAGVARADVFNMPNGQTSLQFVTVGDPGNAADTIAPYCGAVGYAYQMGKYDVTLAQYTTFLNAVAQTDTYGLYNLAMSSEFPTFGIARSGSPGSYMYAVTGTATGRYDMPIFEVSWADAARFCNWVQNGQPVGVEGTGTTETGAYPLNGANTNSDLMAVTRSSTATYVVPTENEWYKAAFYKGGGTNAGYWYYPTRSNVTPSHVLSATGTNNANFKDHSFGYTDPMNYLTPVGYFAASPGPYGTFDQGGDVFQWNDTEVVLGVSRNLRGGSFAYYVNGVSSSYRDNSFPLGEDGNVGFRVASVPEPGSVTLLLVGAVGLLGYACRRKRLRQVTSMIVLLLVTGTVHADVFNMGGTRNADGTWNGLASLEFVTVGDPGNVAATNGYGAVPYTYQMGKFDVTLAQYCEFLNAVATVSDPYGLWLGKIATDFPTYYSANIGISRTGTAGSYAYSVMGTSDNMPAFDVSWGSAARFCNWLQNGQPTGLEGTGTTETGAYTLNGTTSNAGLTAIIRNTGAAYFLPSGSEWYKAGFYKGGGTASGYWTYPTRSDTAPSNVLSATGTNNANFSTDLLTPVGAFANSPGPYGTYDHGGDVWQWNEIIGKGRGWGGGAFDRSSDDLHYISGGISPAWEAYNIGFRVASVPEPGSITLLLASGLPIAACVWRRKRQAT
jgi:formylglycine-generating enzyme